jgi:DNA-binding transcriptional LysR family regulator
MVQLAGRVSEDINEFERKVTGQDLRPSGELRITASDMVLLHLLTDVLVGFRRAYPEITIDVVVSNALLNLSKRDADVAIRATYHPPETLSGKRVARIAWAVYGAKAYGAQSRPQQFDLASDVPRHDWVGFADQSAVGRAAKWLKDRGGEDRVVYKVNTMLGLAEAVAGGIGLALLPSYVGDTVPGLARLTPTLPDLDGELWLLTHPDLRNTARVRAFLDFCAAEMTKRRQVLEGL